MGTLPHRNLNKSRRESVQTDTSKKPDSRANNNINETGAERQRLAKEKKEFKKQKEKFESEKLALEKQRRDLDKQKIEFEKAKESEQKKLNVEKQKIEKERKAFTRQNEKKKEDTGLIDKLYREIDFLKMEIKKKDNKVI